MDIRLGNGFDVHAFCKGDHVWLCGVQVPHSAGLLGHSDADVLVHALCDALLGAIGLGDIGKHFPDNDDTFKGIDSFKLLAVVLEKIKLRGYRLGNLDATIIAQRPRLAPFIPQMREKLAAACACTIEQVNVKATTTEKLGFEGRGEGISAHAIVLLLAAGVPT